MELSNLPFCRHASSSNISSCVFLFDFILSALGLHCSTGASLIVTQGLLIVECGLQSPECGLRVQRVGSRVQRVSSESSVWAQSPECGLQSPACGLRVQRVGSVVAGLRLPSCDAWVASCGGQVKLPHSRWHLSSLIRYQICVPSLGAGSSTTATREAPSCVLTFYHCS